MDLTGTSHTTRVGELVGAFLLGTPPVLAPDELAIQQMASTMPDKVKLYYGNLSALRGFNAHAAAYPGPRILSAAIRAMAANCWQDDMDAAGRAELIAELADRTHALVRHEQAPRRKLRQLVTDLCDTLQVPELPSPNEGLGELGDSVLWLANYIARWYALEYGPLQDTTWRGLKAMNIALHSLASQFEQATTDRGRFELIDGMGRQVQNWLRDGHGAPDGLGESAASELRQSVAWLG